MEKEEKNILLKTRSSRACIRDGYQLFTANFRRIFRLTWPLAIVFAVLSAAASAMAVLVAPWLALPAVALETIFVILLLLAVRRQLYKRGFFEKTEKTGFKPWLRHLGMVLLVLIVCLVIISILTMLTSMPTIIMMAANWTSQMGVINGDPIGMPDYVKWLSIGAFLVAGFLRAYVWMTLLCPFYLMGGSIAMQEKERQEFDLKTNTKKYEEKAIVYRP